MSSQGTTQFLIGPTNEGIRRDLKPFAIPEAAWESLTNCYQWRGRITRRLGTDTLGRLQYNLTDLQYFVSTSSPFAFNLLSVTGFIEGADNSNPGNITTASPHKLTTGDMIVITGVVGATGYNTNNPYTITKINENNFTIGKDAGGYGTYISGGKYISNRSLLGVSGSQPNASIVPGSVIVNVGGEIFTDTGQGTMVSTGGFATGPLTVMYLSRFPNGVRNVQVNSAAHGLITGDTVTLSTITQAGWIQYNGLNCTITVNPSDPTNSFFLNKIQGGSSNSNNTGIWTNLNDPANQGTINYVTGAISLTTTVAGGSAVTVTFAIYPLFPSMGARTRDLFGINNQQTIYFDTNRAYRYDSSTNTIPELPSTLHTEWSGTDYDFFFTTNYSSSFWATNFNPGLHGATIATTAKSGSDTVVTTTTVHGFTVGQTVVFINISGSGAVILNGQSAVINSVTPTTFTVTPTDNSSGPGTGGFALNSSINSPGQDGIRYYTGTTWANYNPPITTTTALQGCLLMFAMRGYLIFLNTWEGSSAGGVQQFGNRARWTFVGTPYYSLPIPVGQSADVETARSDLFRGAGFTDADTGEEIIGADFIRDVLVVYFTNSTWRLRFQQSALAPFVWERVNVEFGTNSTFSTIVFDKGLMAFGGRGIVISDSNNTMRIDQKIPDQVFEIDNANQGPERIFGFRTFKTKLSFWTMPLTSSSGKFPNRTLVYNYEDQTWALFNESFTCLGNFLSAESTVSTLGDLIDPWSTYNDLSWAPTISQVDFENVVAGNQQGFIMLLEQGVFNEPNLSISDISSGTFTSPSHNLEIGDWIKLTGILGTTSDDGTDLNDRNFKVLTTNTNTFTLGEFQSIYVGNVTTPWTSFTYTLMNPYSPIYPGSVEIDVGDFILTDDNNDGILVSGSDQATGVINYLTGVFTLIFSPALGIDTSVIIRVVASQPIVSINTQGTYLGAGLISPISDISIKSKLFNFFPKSQKTRINIIDFYMVQTEFGEVTCDVLADSDSTIPINKPLPDNLRSNVIVTTQNPFEVSDSEQMIYRLYMQSQASTVQLDINLSDQQLAVDCINQSAIELDAMIIHARPSGRLY